MLLNQVGGTFKPAPRLSTGEADALLGDLRIALNRILSNDAGVFSFEELYRAGYTLVLQKFGAKLYGCVSDTLSSHLSDMKLDLVLIPSNLEFCKELMMFWAQYQSGLRMIRDVLMYMDRNYVRQYEKATTYDLGLCLFEEIILLDEEISRRLVERILTLTSDYRIGKLEALPDIAQLGSMILASPGRSTDSERFVFSRLVSAELGSVRCFYDSIAEKLFTDQDPMEYIRSANSAYSTEAILFSPAGIDYPYLLRETRQLLDAVWLSERSSLILKSSFSKSFESPSDLREVFLLFSRTPEANRLLISAFRQEVHARFSLEETSNFDVPYIVDKLRKFSTTLAEAGMEREFMPELHNGIEDVFMKDSCVGISKQLSGFFDKFVKNSVHTSPLLSSTTVDDAMRVFSRILAKDVFEAYYRTYLSKRLLSLPQSALAIEQGITARLKQECGGVYVAKIEGMISDILTSQDSLMQDWVREPQGAVESRVTVLSTSMWSNLAKHTLRIQRLPDAMGAVVKAFEGFYGKKFSGRKLSWVHSQGTAQVVWRVKEGEKFTLTVSSLQAMILLEFNDSDSAACDTIHARLCGDNVSVSPEFKRHLMSLYVNPKYPILLDDASKSMLRVNDEFESSKSRFLKIPLLVDSSIEADLGDKGDTDTGVGVESAVNEERRHLIEAAIVRVMKSKRQLEHGALLASVREQAGNRFVPCGEMIQSRIQNLIDREFISCDNDDVRAVYHYIA